MKCLVLAIIFLFAFSQGGGNRVLESDRDITDEEDEGRDSYNVNEQNTVQKHKGDKDKEHSWEVVEQARVSEDDTNKYNLICQERYNTTANVSGVAITGCRIQCNQNKIYQEVGFTVYVTVPLGKPILIQDGEECGISSKCLKGACYKSDDIEKCQGQLESEPLARIKYGLCGKFCVGAKGKQSVIKAQDGISCGFFGQCVRGKCNFFYRVGQNNLN